MPIRSPEIRELSIEIEAYLRREGDEHRRVFEMLMPGIIEPFLRVLSIWESSLREGGKLLLFGNGGSASHAQHIATELVVRYQADRAAIAAVALTADASVVTAGANDLGYDRVFSRQLEALGRAGDVAVGISTSGRSANVLAGLRAARQRKLHTTGLIGGDGGEMLSLCDAAIVVPSHATPRVQEMHLFVAHLLCKAVESRLGLVT